MKAKYLLFIPLVFSLVWALTSCGKETVIREVLVTTPTPATEAPAETQPKSNKYDQYIEFVLDNSGQARDWTESDLIETATLVCGAFDDGASLDSVVTVFSNNSSGDYDNELFAAIIGGAVTYLCPEWQGYVNSQLS